MPHLLDIAHLTVRQANTILERAFFFKKERIFPNFSGNRLANLFYENSTRTRVSFEIAAQNLSIPTVNLDLASSSEQKGELIADTLQTLMAMEINLFVIRHAQNGLLATLAEVVNGRGHLINAGEGTHAHPSQALLDIMTIIEKKGSLSSLKVAIVGDIAHSRVANSLQCLFALLGVGELRLVAPPSLQPNTIHFGYLTASLEEGITDVDVLICLRVQRERFMANETLNWEDYHQRYGITKERLGWAKSDVMLMHPGPVNRGIEIESELVDCEQSSILQQVNNGVYVRMAIIESLLR